MTNADIIKTISFDQGEILNNILSLGKLKEFDADVTYSKGSFYKTVPQPRFKFDLNPQCNGVVRANATNLPVKSSSLSSVVFDPPFILRRQSTENSLMHNRFSSYETKEKLLSFYSQAIKEVYRVLAPHGLFVFKCQDTVDSGKNHWIHNDVLQFALLQGFIGLDLYVLLAKSRIIGRHHHNQQHARKFHSYFWVFKKP